MLGHVRKQNAAKTQLKGKPRTLESHACCFISAPFSPTFPAILILLEEERMGMEGKKRFAVLLCAEDPDYVKKTYGGYLKVFTALLEDEGEIWDAFRATKGELPTEEEVEIYDGFIVTGSASDAYADEVWILNLLAFLRRLHVLQKRILGICFGHQILSRALGGSIGRASNGWDIGVTCIHRSPRSNKLLIPPHLPVIQCHQDEVFDLPPHVEVLARSEKTGIEMFRCGDHILGIQGHPEYTKDILLFLMDRLLQLNVIQASHAEAVKEALNVREPDREAWERICKGFLKGGLVL